GNDQVGGPERSDVGDAAVPETIVGDFTVGTAKRPATRDGIVHVNAHAIAARRDAIEARLEEPVELGRNGSFVLPGAFDGDVVIGDARDRTRTIARGNARLMDEIIGDLQALGAVNPNAGAPILDVIII